MQTRIQPVSLTIKLHGKGGLSAYMQKPLLKVSFRSERSEQGLDSRPSPAAELEIDTPALRPRNLSPAPRSFVANVKGSPRRLFTFLFLLPPPPISLPLPLSRWWRLQLC